MTAARGFSLLELLIALVLGALVLIAAFGLLHGYTSLARATDARAVRNETLRIAAHVLMAETRWSQPLRDVRAVAPDSLALRAYRAIATVCQENADGTALAGVAALRAPDAGKDSVLVLRHAEPDIAASLLLAEPHTPACPGRSLSYRVRASIPLQVGDLLLVFEPGTYYLSQRALRYRLGAEGRQPLTGEYLNTGRSFFVATSEGLTAWLVAQAPRGGEETLRARLPFLAQQP
jgi:prepilin-type N-terminal cleavage/methylation domain-containing protein